jgi:hypothetical protein
LAVSATCWTAMAGKEYEELKTKNQALGSKSYKAGQYDRPFFFKV